MSITFTITATNDITSFSESDLPLNTTLTISSINDSERPNDSIDNNDFRFEWFIVDKPDLSNASVVLLPQDIYRSSVTLNSIDIWGTYRIFVTAMNMNTGVFSEVNLFVAPESHFINISIKSNNNNLEKPAATQRDWNTIYSSLTEVVDNTTKSINQIKVASDKTFILPVEYGTDGQVLTTSGDGILSWQDASAGSSLAGLTSSIIAGEGTLTISSGYKLIPDADDHFSSIGTVAVPFNEINAENVYSDILFVGALQYPSTDGTSGQALTTSGNGVISFQNISYDNLVDVPTVTQSIDADTGSETLTFGGGRTLNILGGDNVTTSVASDNNSIDVTINAVGGGGGIIVGDKIEEGDTSIEVIDSGVDGQIVFKTNNQSRWSFNKDGHLMPSANSLYDIGSAENKVRHLYLSSNSLNIGENSLSVGINDQISSTNSNKSLDLDVSSISLKKYDFSALEIEPESIIAGITYRIVNPGSVDFTLVGASVNEAGHIFESTDDGVILSNDGIATLNQSNINPTKSYVYVEKNDIDDSKTDLKHHDGIESKSLISINSSGIQDNSILTYNFGSWSASNIENLSYKSWHATHSDGWPANYTRSFVQPGSSYTQVEGPSYYIFSFLNNTGNSLVVKKISLTCNEMHSGSIDWSASFSSINNFKSNISETLPAMSLPIRMYRTNENNIDAGIGVSEWNDITYNQNGQSELLDGHFLLILINDMAEVDPSVINKRFTATVYYS